jgi:hypothetical protein
MSKVLVPAADGEREDLPGAACDGPGGPRWRAVR